MKVKLNEYYKHSYNSVWWYKWMWHPRNWFRREMWNPHLYPSYATSFIDAMDNVLAFLSPWFSVRRMMFSTFFNENGTKLLSNDRRSAFVRTRDGSNLYYHLVASGLGAKLFKVEYKNSKGENNNAFIAALVATFAPGADEDSENLKEVKTLVYKQSLCLTKKQCQKFLDAVVDKTPNMEWWERDENGEIILEEDKNEQ